MSTVSPYILTAQDVALRLNVTPRRVRQIPSGELPYLQLADRGERRYRPDDVAAYLAARIRGRTAEEAS